jgi:Skp family chaperone for outer membrane proteins
MTRLAKILAPAGLMVAAGLAMPAHAQVDGKIATLDMPGVFVGTDALRTSNEQIRTQYAQQIDLLRTRSQEQQTVLAKYDKNGDKNIDDAEMAAMKKTPDNAKYEALEKEIVSLGNQVDGAGIFAVEQIAVQYRSALDDVVKREQIKAIIDPKSLMFAAPEADITAKVIAALNLRVPAVGVIPPAGWQPTNQVAQLYQQIQQRLLLLAQMAQQQAGQTPAQPAPADPNAPAGR